MSNLIVFNVYEEERLTGSKDLRYSTLLKTNLTATEVVDSFEVYEGFSICVVEGIALSFIDFSCINISPESIKEKLKTVPTTDESPQISLPSKCSIKIESESNDERLPRSKNELVYTYKGFECGASGFGETIVQWVVTHPCEMIFIGGWIWDRTKDLISFILKTIFKKAVQSQSDLSAPILFSPKRFHKKLSQLINLDPLYFQILEISPIAQGKYNIVVRTIKNEKYEVVSTTNGDILSLKLSGDQGKGKIKWSKRHPFLCTCGQTFLFIILEAILLCVIYLISCQYPVAEREDYAEFLILILSGINLLAVLILSILCRKFSRIPLSLVNEVRGVIYGMAGVALLSKILVSYGVISDLTRSWGSANLVDILACYIAFDTLISIAANEYEPVNRQDNP